MSSSPPKQGGRYNLDDYVTVSQRIERFYEKHPDGRIITNVVEVNHETGFVLMQAMIYRTNADAHPAATGHAFEVRGDSYINKSSYIENCESSAVGRALALLGFEVRRSISSREEMEKVGRMTPVEAPAGERSKPAPAPPAKPTEATVAKPAAKADTAVSEEQKEEILALLQRERPGDRRAQQKLLTEMTGKSSREELTEPEAARLIGQLKKGGPSLAANTKT